MLPTDFKPPEGVEFQLDPNDPLVPQAQQVMFDVAHGKLTPAEALAKFAGLYAAGKIGDAQTTNTARQAEIGKLGANGTARVTAVETWLASQVGAELAKHMGASGMATARQIEGWEKIMRNSSSQGAAAFSQVGRDSTPQGKLDDAAYDKLSPAERMNYARQFPQEQFTNGRAN